MIPRYDVIHMERGPVLQITTLTLPAFYKRRELRRLRKVDARVRRRQASDSPDAVRRQQRLATAIAWQIAVHRDVDRACLRRIHAKHGPVELVILPGQPDDVWQRHHVEYAWRVVVHDEHQIVVAVLRARNDRMFDTRGPRLARDSG